jgi:hypothetical protein
LPIPIPQILLGTDKGFLIKEIWRYPFEEFTKNDIVVDNSVAWSCRIPNDRIPPEISLGNYY